MKHFDRNLVGDEGFSHRSAPCPGNPIAGGRVGSPLSKSSNDPEAMSSSLATGRELMEALRQLLKRSGLLCGGR